MSREVRTVVYDTELQLEAYQFEGIMQNSPIIFMTTTSLDLLKKANGILSATTRNTY